MGTIPCCPALIYIENGALPVAQMFVRPLSMIAGRSYDKWDARLEYPLITKIAVVALAIIFLPLAIPAMGLSFLALSLSSSHKEQCAALFSPQIDFRRLATPSEDPVKEKEELENAKTRTCNFIDEISKEPSPKRLLVLRPCELEAVAKVRATIGQATTFAEILKALRSYYESIWHSLTMGCLQELKSHIREIQSKANKPYESFIKEIKEFVTSIKAEVKPLESSPGADKLKILCEYFYEIPCDDISTCDDISKFWTCIQDIANEYKSVFGREHKELKSYLASTHALLITPAAA